MKDELADVDEPSRCEYDIFLYQATLSSHSTFYLKFDVFHVRYVAILSTPIVCLEDKLKVLHIFPIKKVEPS